MDRRISGIVAAAALSGLTTFALTPRAAACGGFFCNNSGIDQSGENILFSINADGTVSTVVQIQYQGPSETFAWILPVPAEPTVSVGTDALFTALSQSTAPQFYLQYETEGECRAEPSCYNGPWFGAEDDRSGAGSFQDGGVASPDPGVDVRFRGNVGPYDVAVLAAGDPVALRDWLGDNGYLIPAEASAELDYYVALGNYFVALKLQKDRDTGEIQPIVLRSDNDEPCIPIRLTRIAATPDMPVTAYFLAESRYRPMNYMLVNPDLEDAGLYTGTSTYASAVSRAVDDAGGHAFVTDYAGDVPAIDITLGSIEHLRTETNAKRFLEALLSTGLRGDSQLLSILLRNVPPPTGTDPQSFYNCLVNEWCTEYDAYVNGLTFDPSRLVDELNEGVITPREEAQALLSSHGHLTRLFTTLSPSEMTEDPTFAVSGELPRESSNRHEATMVFHCGPEYFQWTAPTSIRFASGRDEHVSDGVAYYGTDSQYCEDRGAGFYPGASMDQLREIASSRGNVLRGGGLCAVTRGTPTAWPIGLALLGLASLGLAFRRRRR
ncbi:MAG: DUF2330 domain-containing protein [Sandaracinaceae bacterium]